MKTTQAPRTRVLQGWVMLSGTPQKNQRWDRTDGTGASGSLIRDYQGLMFQQRLGRAEQAHNAAQVDHATKRAHLDQVLRYREVIQRLKTEAI